VPGPSETPSRVQRRGHRGCVGPSRLVRRSIRKKAREALAEIGLFGNLVDRQTSRYREPCTFQSPDLKDLRKTLSPGFPKHLLFYRFDEQEVFVVRVIHGARDLERLFSHLDAGDQ
jgi:plasmid stabilization system protein ParE